MYTKLTLRLDDGIIRKAKRIAKKRKTSVSHLVSDYFKILEDDMEDGGARPAEEDPIDGGSATGHERGGE